MRKAGNPKRKKKKRNRTPSKKTCQRIHALKRLKERYDLGEEDYNSIKRKHIKYRLSVFVSKQSLRVTIHKLNYGEKWVFFCWDKSRGEIITFLKPEWVESGEVLDLTEECP